MRTSLGLVALGILLQASAPAGACTVFALVDNAIATPAPAAAATVTFIANAGVQIDLAGEMVLVDALFDLNFATGAPPSRYTHLERADLERLEQGLEPFACADLVLVTHGHDDHATRASVASHLTHCSRAELFLPDGAWPDAEPPWPPGRVHPVSLAPGSSAVVRDGAVRVEALGLRHGSRTGTEPPHLGWLISGAGVRILHVGDATPMPDNLHDFGGALSGTIDLALVPHWFVTHEGGRTWLLEELKPRRIAVVHVVEKDPRVMEALDALGERYPEWTILTPGHEPLEIAPAGGG